MLLVVPPTHLTSPALATSLRGEKRNRHIGQAPDGSEGFMGHTQHEAERKRGPFNRPGPVRSPVVPR